MKIAGCAFREMSGHQAGLLLLEHLYREATGQSLPPILRTERGKPYFPDSSWHFSISHTKRHAFCVLARENVAIDAEEADRPIRLELADKILSPGEKAQFDAAGDKRKALLTFWVLKEAQAKLTGKGLGGYPNATDFRLDDPRVTQSMGCILAVMTGSDNGGQNTPMGGEYNQ